VAWATDNGSGASAESVTLRTLWDRRLP